jgi:hypothetical protein
MYFPKLPDPLNVLRNYMHLAIASNTPQICQSALEAFFNIIGHINFRHSLLDISDFSKSDFLTLFLHCLKLLDLGNKPKLRYALMVDMNEFRNFFLMNFKSSQPTSAAFFKKDPSFSDVALQILQALDINMDEKGWKFTTTEDETAYNKFLKRLNRVRIEHSAHRSLAIYPELELDDSPAIEENNEKTSLDFSS